MEFIVGGIDRQSAYGDVFRFRVPNAPTPTRSINPGSFGMSWGGQLEIVNRLVQGFAPGIPSAIQGLHPEIDAVQLSQTLRTQNEFIVPYDSLPLQDCVDLAIFLIRTTISAQNLSVGIRGVGGTIEVVTITPTEGVKWVQKKGRSAENGHDRMGNVRHGVLVHVNVRGSSRKPNSRRRAVAAPISSTWHLSSGRI